MDEIKHKGVVSSVTHNTLYVLIINETACASCHARSVCSASDFREKEIEITSFHKNYHPGDGVTIVMRGSQGMNAVLYAYGFPFLILFLSLLLVFTLTGNEILSGLIALAMLVPYFGILWLFRDKFKTTFRFELEE
jgi:sigma-E factor negative regulatory protein RseC